MLALCGLLLLTFVGTVLTIASTEDANVETRAGGLGVAMALAVVALIVLVGDLEREARMRRNSFQHYVNQNPLISAPPLCNNVASASRGPSKCNYVAFESLVREAPIHDIVAAPAITSGRSLKADMVRVATLVSQHGWCTIEAKRLLSIHPLKEVVEWLYQGHLLDRSVIGNVTATNGLTIPGEVYLEWNSPEMCWVLDNEGDLWVAPEAQDARRATIEQLFENLYGTDEKYRFAHALTPCVQTLCDESTGVCSLYLGEYAQLWRMPKPGEHEWERMLSFHPYRTTNRSPKYSVAVSYLYSLMN